MGRIPIAEWLRTGGHDVIEAASADEALTVLSSRLDIDLVVTAVRMPGSLNGLALTHLIRSGNQPLPVIVMSGDTFERDAKVAGAAAFFQKPFDFGEITRRTADILAEPSGDGRSSAATC